MQHKNDCSFLNRLPAFIKCIMFPRVTSIPKAKNTYFSMCVKMKKKLVGQQRGLKVKDEQITPLINFFSHRSSES